jgi:phage gp45-like
MNISIKKGSVSKNTSDKTDRPIQSVEYLGRDGNVEVFFPYGLHANVPKGAMAILFSMLGQSSNKVAMLSAPQERVKVETGEVVLFHPITQAKTYFKNDGSIVTNTDEATLSILKDGKIEVKNSGGSITLNSDGTATIDSSQVTMTGNLQVDGNINAGGSIVAGTTISAGTSVTAPTVSGTTGLSGGGKSMVNHTHNFIDTGKVPPASVTGGNN